MLQTREWGKKKKEKKRENFRKQSLKSDRKILLMKPCLRALVKCDVVFTSTVTQAAFTTSPLITAGRCLPSEICGSQLCRWMDDPALVDGWENNAPGKGIGEHAAPLTTGLCQLGFGAKERRKRHYSWGGESAPRHFCAGGVRSQVKMCSWCPA